MFDNDIQSNQLLLISSYISFDVILKPSECQKSQKIHTYLINLTKLYAFDINFVKTIKFKFNIEILNSFSHEFHRKYL